MREPTAEQIEKFIADWSKSGGHERGSGQHFLLDFCDLLGLDKPSPPVAENALNAYTFERRVDRRKPDGSSTPNWIDLYKRAHLVLETKQGVNPRRDKSDPDQPLLPDLSPAPASQSMGHGHRGSPAWDKALDRAHAQAERYIHLLPPGEPRPPFLIVCDVGHCFDLYAEFSGTGGQYEAFPTPRKRRVHLSDLRDPEIRTLFRKIWTDPHSLDPSRHAAAVTRKVARALADLAKSLELDGHHPQVTAGFLQRCLFTMFAEDIGLLPENAFVGMLESVREQPAALVALLRPLWQDMATGSDFSASIRARVAHFNGGLFEDTNVLPLRGDQIAYLLHAAKQDWSAVEPAIFGTLLERALDPLDRHKLGAHYTPRGYVERLVRPTVIEPLRAEWESVRIAAAQLDDQGKTKDARDAVEAFHHKLAAIRVLDPACGSGNFLYVALELLKRLEAEVLDLFEALGGNRKLEMDTAIIRPGNFLGIELNPRAAAIAQLVLWIGYLQWNKRTTGRADTNERPILPRKNTIECRDAVLACDEKIPRRSPETGEYLTIWDGQTTKIHPVTGKDVPDEAARTVLFDYVNPRRAEWPEADFIVGNPPFIGASRMRDALGDGYTEALRKAWKGAVPDSADLVMFWWCMAAATTARGRCKRFGFITTNSIHQTFNRRVIEPFLSDPKHPLHLAFAIPDHPWVDSADGAAVRIAMTVAAPGKAPGILEQVTAEQPRDDGEHEVTLSRNAGVLAPNLQIGADLTSCGALQANSKISCPGVKLHGSGFIVTPDEAALLGLGSVPGIERHIRGYRNGKDLTDKPRGVMVIDLFGLTDTATLERFPSLYQHLALRVKPERDQNNRDTYRLNWWIFGEPRRDFRTALAPLPRYIATVETSKHRFFTFLDRSILPDNMLVAIASDDAYHLGVLSSSIHVTWALAAGGRLGMGNDPRYNKSRCFEPFPFPSLEEGGLKQRIRDLGERLDAHRKRQQAQHPGLTLTGMYNVLEKLRSGEPLDAKDKQIHDQGLVSILKQLLDELDAAVLEAYGWQQVSSGKFQVSSVGDPPPSSLETSNLKLETTVPPADLLARGGPAAESLEQALLTRLVALNHERAAEEQRGLIRWLRPDYQNCGGAPRPSHDSPAADSSATATGGHRPPLQDDLPGTEPSSLETENLKLETSSPATWPDRMPEQVTLIRHLLTADPAATAETLSARFGRKNRKRAEQIEAIIDTLGALGKL